jgi:hypothetical protein
LTWLFFVLVHVSFESLAAFLTRVHERQMVSAVLLQLTAVYLPSPHLEQALQAPVDLKKLELQEVH